MIFLSGLAVQQLAWILMVQLVIDGAALSVNPSKLGLNPHTVVLYQRH